MTDLRMLPSKTLYVLGAGFTKAFLPNAPLLIDYYETDQLAKKFENFDYSRRLISLELHRFVDGRIDIERLLSRLDTKMPYDFEHGVISELSLLRSAVLTMFMDRLNKAKEGFEVGKDLLAFAKHCISDGISCITFNYDDLLDQALWEVTRTDVASHSPYWHPDGGYGFYCRPSLYIISDSTGRIMDATSMDVLKLHGSLNWRVRRGHLPPYTMDAIVHHETWLQVEGQSHANKINTIEEHLQPEPFMVPPVLAKTDLGEQPILRLVWHKAFLALRSAQHVVFVGYSFPPTDFAADVLFTEALDLLPLTHIQIVNLADTETEKRNLRRVYRSRLGNIPASQFDFQGALEWSRRVSAY